MARVTFDQYHPAWPGIYDRILRQKWIRYQNQHGRPPSQNWAYTGIMERLEKEAAAEATEAIRQLRTIKK